MKSNGIALTTAILHVSPAAGRLIEDNELYRSAATLAVVDPDFDILVSGIAPIMVSCS